MQPAVSVSSDSVSSLIAKHSGRRPAGERTVREKITVECERYFSDKLVRSAGEDIMSFWRRNCKSYPFLAVLAQAVFCVPCTSTPSERVFSIAGLIVRNKRASLAPDTVSKVLFIHDNYQLCKSCL